MEIHVSKFGGFCPGVKRADKEIKSLLSAKCDNESIYILGPLIHNDIYNQELIALGANIISFQDKEKSLLILA